MAIATFDVIIGNQSIMACLVGMLLFIPPSRLGGINAQHYIYIPPRRAITYITYGMMTYSIYGKLV